MHTDPVRIGRSLAAGPFRVREIAYAAGLHQPRHTHAAMSVTLLIAGSIREWAGSREESGSALSVVVKPAGIEHADEVGPRGARTLQIEFETEAVRELFDARDGLERWRWLHGRAPARTMLALLELARNPDAPQSEAEDHVLDALGTLAPDRPAAGEPPSWLKRVKEKLDDDLARPATVRELARVAGVHEVSVSRAFHRHYGCTLTDYRRRERVRRAAGRIESGADELSRIAHATGFADHAHLCREFRTATGLTPSRYRRLATG